MVSTSQMLTISKLVAAHVLCRCRRVLRSVTHTSMIGACQKHMYAGIHAAVHRCRLRLQACPETARCNPQQSTGINRHSPVLPMPAPASSAVPPPAA